MPEEVVPVKKAIKKKKKKTNNLDILVKEYKSDPSELRFVLFLARESGLPYQQIDLKKYEVLIFLLKEYIKRKSPDKAKQINKMIKETFSKTNLSTFEHIQSISDKDETKRLIMNDIFRAFGNPEDPNSIAAKSLNDIYTFPTKVYNCAHEPYFLMQKLYEYNGKSLGRQIFFKPAGKPNDGPQYQASHFYIAGLNRSLLISESLQNN